MQLTPHFSLAELTTTNTKIDNVPSKETIEVLRTTAFYMEKVREILGNVAITINSGYRSPDVNRQVGGTSNSSHTFGYAVDFTAYGHTPLTISNILAKSSLKFDQLIYEKTWVHISFDPRMRGNILTLKSKGKYVKGIV
jgi:polyribonucleotide nucleotidyltransferase